MTVYSFELHFTAPAGEEMIDALYEAGWDDATVSLDPGEGGPGVASFDRESSTAVEAVASAIAQGRAAGVEITGASEDLVTLAEIAERTGRSFATADHWAAGRRGPGGFPAPKVRRPRVSLWSWAEVVTWLHENRLAEVSPMEVEVARVCEVADSLIRAHRLQRRLPAEDRARLCHAVS
ncbi:helix-turn-helix transcriptional regulator [Streptosporangium sandarakinum]